jgi:cobalt-zinc-cadmium efflux system membrane fusion protein
VRSRFAGEVAALPDAYWAQTVEKIPGKTRPYSVGDHVKQADLLAVVWSKDLGDKKAALIDAIIDLRRDEAYLKDLKKLYFEQGAVAKATLQDAERTVRKGISARNAAERTLLMWKLTDPEIAAIKKEAETIGADSRDPKKEKNWARVEVRAPKAGVIVERNTHLGDWVDPSNYGTPMYRIADLDKLSVWINPEEEYLPFLQRYLNKRSPTTLKWDMFLQADINSPPLKGELVRIGPSLDPNQHTPLLVGRVENKNHDLVVGQFVTTTFFVPPDEEVVAIPTTALNEEQGKSVIMIQPDPNKLEFTLRAVSVAYRFKDVVFVRRVAPTERSDQQLRVAEPRFTKKAKSDLPQVQGLEPNVRVVAQSVVELTKALRDLRAKGHAAMAP